MSGSVSEDFKKALEIEVQRWAGLGESYLAIVEFHKFVLAEFAKAEQQWQKERLEELKKQAVCDFFGQFNSVNDCCQTCPAAGDCAGKKIEKQKKQLQALIKELEQSEHFLEKNRILKKLVELNK